MLVGSPVTYNENQDVPTQPRHLKRWLKALPLANLGETTRLFSTALSRFNARELPPSERLELLELMRPTQCFILEKLGRHFINRALPLPPRSQRIAELNHQVLEEVARGYLRVVEACRLDEGALRPRHQTLAMHRALRALCLQLFHAARLYQPAPEGLWKRIHGVFALAERRGLKDQAVKDIELTCQSRCSIEETYKQACLFALADPLTLHQGDTDRLIRYLESHAGECTLGGAAIPDNGGHLYVLDLEADAPPAHVPREESPRGGTIRHLNPAPVVRRLRTCTDVEPESGRMEHLTAEQAARVIRSWTSTARRRFSRSPTQGRMEATIGVDRIHALLREGPRGKAPRRNGKDRLQPLSRKEDLETLLTLADRVPSHHHQSEGISVQFLEDLPVEGSASLWDQISRGRPIRDPAGGPPEEERTGQDPWETVTHWQILDASAGGFRLCWAGDTVPRAQVGELMALRDEGTVRGPWRVGMIRWMTHREDGRLEVGVKMLAPRTLPVEISPALRHHGTRFLPGLLLPALEVLGQPSTLVCQAGRFQAGERVKVRLEGRTQEVLLPSAETQSTRFVQFRYQPVEPPDNPRARPGSGATPPSWPEIL
ncbi:MAG: hypothetical protein ACLFTM_02535 [Ectothiorhodospira sp.]